MQFVAQWSVRLERRRQVREGVRHDGRYDQGFFFCLSNLRETFSNVLLLQQLQLLSPDGRQAPMPAYCAGLAAASRGSRDEAGGGQRGHRYSRRGTERSNTRVSPFLREVCVGILPTLFSVRNDLMC